MQVHSLLETNLEYFSRIDHQDFNEIVNYVYVGVSMCLYVDLKAGAE